MELPKIEERITLKQQLRAFSRSGLVARFHTRAQLQPQNVGHHTYGVLYLLWVITGGQLGRDLMYAALVHDVPEFVSGDCPAPAKVRPGVREAFEQLETDTLLEARLPLPVLDDEEARLLKLADSLEGMRHCVYERQLGNQLIKTCFERYRRFSLELAKTPREQYVWSFFNQCWEEANHGA